MTGENTRILHEKAMELARQKLAESLAGKDAYLMQAVKALDDLNDAFNIVTGRLAEWYGIHYPELDLRPNELLDFVLQHGGRGDGESMGAPMGPEDIAAIQGLALMAKSIFYERKALEEYIKVSIEEASPNLANVLGPTLGARIIARAGGLEKLAKMPASSIQVMGAGEALFKHLKMGTPSPKHGVIYKHPLILGAPKRARGKISRMLANKAAIAARVDYYSGETIDLGDLNAKAAAIKGRTKREKKP